MSKIQESERTLGEILSLIFTPVKDVSLKSHDRPERAHEYTSSQQDQFLNEYRGYIQKTQYKLHSSTATKPRIQRHFHCR